MSQLTAVRSEAGAKTHSPFTTAQLQERAVYRRAVEAVICGTPAVNHELMYQEMVRKVWRLADIERIGSR
jgi:hypothetical protein